MWKQAEEMAQLVTGLLHKHEDLSSIPSTHVRKPGMGLVTPALWGMETKKEWINPWSSLASLAKLVSSRFSDSALKNQGGEQSRKTPQH